MPGIHSVACSQYKQSSGKLVICGFGGGLAYIFVFKNLLFLSTVHRKYGNSVIRKIGILYEISPASSCRFLRVLFALFCCPP